VIRRRSEIGTGQPGRHDTPRISLAIGSPIGSTAASNRGSDVGGADSTPDAADPTARVAATPQAAVHDAKRAIMTVTCFLSIDRNAVISRESTARLERFASPIRRPRGTPALDAAGEMIGDVDVHRTPAQRRLDGLDRLAEHRTNREPIELASDAEHANGWLY
jgi:hypothetical protein